MKGFRNVFCFTFRQLIRVKSFRLLTLVLALLMFLVPALLLPLNADSSDEQEEIIYIEDDETDGANEAVTPELIACVMAEGIEPDWPALLATGLKGYTDTDWKTCSDLEAAENACAGKASLILLISLGDDSYTSFDTIVPDDSRCSTNDAILLVNTITEQYESVLLQNLTPEQQEALQAAGEESLAEDPAEWETGEIEDSYGAEEEEEEAVTDEDEDTSFGSWILALVLPYLNIMLVYFMVLYYGQYTANCVMLEKTSKLMDTMLVSVKPWSMIMGKVAATWAASAVQFLIWLASLVAGLAAGMRICLWMNPQTGSAAVLVMQLFTAGLGTLSAVRIILAVSLVLAGYFMYCALSSIGGAIAGKPEELSATNTIFNMVIIISFMGAMYSGFMNNTLGDGIAWVDLVPSVSALITPARILIGSIPVYGGVISLAITLAAAALIMLLSGRIYIMMSMYKGTLPKLKQLFNMLRGKE